MSRNMTQVNIMGIPFVNSSREKFVQDKIGKCIDQRKRCFIVTANPEIVMETNRNIHYKKIVQSATYIVPDGVGIILASKRKKEPLQERIAGIDLFVDMLTMANEKQASCFFIGASEEVNEQTVARVKKRFPNLRVAGRHHGYFDINEDNNVAERVKEADPDFVFVALGFPKQEEWIDHHFSTVRKGIFIGLGGSFDVFAGKVKRAPDSWVRLNLEWLYRILKQPFRFKRILPLLKFLTLIIFRKI